MSIIQEWPKFNNRLFQLMLIKALYSQAYSPLLSSRHHLFSKSKGPPLTPKLSEGAQKAIMSVKIMNLILEKRMPTSFKDQTLTQQILSLEDTIANYKIQQQVRQTFFKMFKEGIYLNPYIYCQDRRRDAKPQHQQNKDFQVREEKQKFIFFPTRLTTRQIFSTLAQIYQQNSQNFREVFVTGGFGIGKTISTILYNQLSRHIHEYHLKFIEAKEAIAHQNPTDQGIKLFQEYNRLIAQQLLFIVPKCLYWSIKRNIDQKQQLSIEESILQQVDELSEKQRKQLRDCIQKGDISSFKRKLRSLYPQILIKGVVDQLNVLTDMLREHDRHEQQRRLDIRRKELGVKISQSKQTVEDKNMQQQKRTMRLRVLMRNLSHYRKCGHNTIFYSSFNIEQELLQDLKLYDPKWHNVPLKSNIQFQDLLRQSPGANIVFWQYFYFQIERRLKLQKVPSEKLKEIKNAFFKKCEQAKVEVNSYFRIVHIRIFFKQKDWMLLGIHNKQNAQLQGALFSLIESFHNQCVKSIVNMFKQFLANNKKQQYSLFPSQKKKMFFQICLSENQKNSKKQHNTTQVPTVDQTVRSKKQNYVKIEESLFERFLNKYIQPYKQSEGVECQMGQMFFVSHQLGPQIRLLLSSKQAMEILYPVLFPKIAESIPFGRYFKEYMKDCASRREILFKLTLLQCLIQGVQVNYCVQICFPQRKENPRKQEFRISKAITFSSLPQLEKDQKRVDFPKIFSVENCFKELLTLAKDKPGEHFVGIRSQQQVFDEIKPSIDFVRAYYDIEKGTLNLSTFDLTASKSSSLKQKNATRMLKNFLKEEQGVHITHIIMCPKSAMPKKLKASGSKVSIQYADIYRVNIFRNQSREAADKIDVYRMLADLYKYQEEEKQEKKQTNDQ